MHCGLDFGTSNSLLGYSRENNIQFADLEGTSKSIPSVALAMGNHKVTIEITDAEIMSEYRRFYGEKSVSSSGEMTQQHNISLVKNRLLDDKRKKAAKSNMNISLSDISETSQYVYGQNAITTYEETEEGRFIRSPKSFLGGALSPQMAFAQSTIVSNMLKHYKTCAGSHIGTDLESVVIGRPINWGVNHSQEANDRALKLMTKSGHAAGFKNIEFEYEPIAAAIDLERTLNKEHRVLVIDIGGGTTDAAMVLLSNQYCLLNNRDNQIISSHGTRVGGIDLDIKIAYRRLCRELGSCYIDGQDHIINNATHHLNQLYINACAVNDVHRIEEFQNSGEAIAEAIQHAPANIVQKLRYLQVLQHNDHSARFIRTAEAAKISLSDSKTTTACLGYLNLGLNHHFSRTDLLETCDFTMERINQTILKVVEDAGTNPDLIMLTGGVTNSKTLMATLNLTRFGVNIYTENSFSSVCRGLSLKAERVFS